MVTIKQLNQLWNDILPYGQGFLQVPDEHPLSFHIGYENGEHKCFVILDTGYIESIPSSKAITTDCILMKDDSYCLRFILNYQSLDELFIKLCWDLIDVSRNDKCPVKKIIEEYNNWARLFQGTGNEIMSSSAQKGLLGELLFLNEKIDELGATSAIKSWTGPDGSDQDFIFNDSWAEVKAVSIAANEVKISSLQQLDRNDLGYLIIYFMDKTTTTGMKSISLYDMIIKIRMKLNKIYEKDLFECKLSLYGYREKDKAKYIDANYYLLERRDYIVNEEFPRLSRKNVSNAIFSAKYSIGLALLEEFRIKRR